MTGMHYLGAVTMVVSLSDTGYICAVEVVRGIEDKLDKQAVDAMRQQVFQPIRLEGKPTAGDMTVQRDFWRADASDTLYSENAGASSSEISLEAKSFHALGISSVAASGRVESDTYRNQYFGVSFVALGAKVTLPSVVDDHANSARLVDAVARSQNHDDRYSVSILVESLSNYPNLKSLDDYVEQVSAQFKREGTERARDDFPYTISGIVFVGAVFKIHDGSDASHFRAIFSTVMKGYLLSLDVTAAKEQQALTIASSIQFK
jgi:hypothetical protein